MPAVLVKSLKKDSVEETQEQRIAREASFLYKCATADWPDVPKGPEDLDDEKLRELMKLRRSLWT